VLCSSGRVNKPFLKAGAKKVFWMMNKHTIWPKVKETKCQRVIILLVVVDTDLLTNQQQPARNTPPVERLD
jgi:hypothetical protein